MLVYGGDNGLETPAVVQHVQAHLDLGPLGVVEHQLRGRAHREGLRALL